MDLLLKYFPGLNAAQQQRFAALKLLYEEWNSRINVISRKDMDSFYERHVLHSLGIARVISFAPGTTIMDVGTGGGFPGIPLAILFPESSFTLVDSIGKKIKVVKEVSEALQINNVMTIQLRAEDVKQNFDFVVSRAVTEFPVFYKWVKPRFNKMNRNTLPNGILYLKGGNLQQEFGPFYDKTRFFELKDFFDEPFFETKKVAYYPV